MAKSSKIALLKEILDSAESSIRSAKQMLNELMGQNGMAEMAKSGAAEKTTSSISKVGEHHVIEGPFDGQNMQSPDGKTYSVPANYASKSKLVPGDILKLTITEDGTFVYKQIGPVERKKIIGVLTYDDGQYRVIANGKSYKVLLASVTYFKGDIGDRITIVVPEHEETDWAAIENVLPKIDDGLSVADFQL